VRGGEVDVGDGAVVRVFRIDGEMHLRVDALVAVGDVGARGDVETGDPRGERKSEEEKEKRAVEEAHRLTGS
jgi:hypothetical protein